MEEQTSRLVQGVYEKYKALAPEKRYLIGISGIPGSGKTSLALNTVSQFNALSEATSPGSPPPAAYLPMDGFHYTRAQLSAMPDPEQAHARRGAAFTFDSPALLKTIQALRSPLTSSSSSSSSSFSSSPSPTKDVLAPSFDHKLKDPVFDDIKISPTAKVVVVEGNYLSLNKGVWREIADLMDELWFVNVDFAVAKRRLIKRHVAAGIAADEAAAAKRADENDLVNGREIVDERWEDGITEFVDSIEDKDWSV